jgi:hypothetical protein
MQPQHYITMNKKRQRIEALRIERLGCGIGQVVCVAISLFSTLTGDWKLVASAALVMCLPFVAKALVTKQLDEAEEDLFQWRLEHGGLDMSRFKDFRK